MTILEILLNGICICRVIREKSLKKRARRINFSPNISAEKRHFLHHYQNFPAIQTSVVDSEIATAVAGKTFLEKVFLLHELFSVAGHGANANRKSRHLYDLYQMMDKDFAIAAVKDDELWENIRHHREIFTSVKDIDYTPDVRKRIVLIPREDIISVWEKDYAEMLVNMIYGTNKPTFNQIIEKMQVLQDRFRQ